MRVCLVSAELAPFFAGGAGTYAREMALALADAGCQVHVLTYPREGMRMPSDPHLPGVQIHGLDLSSGQAGVPAYNCRALRHSMGVLEALRRLHDAHRFDVIEFPDFGGEGYFTMRARRSLGEFEDVCLAVRCHTPISVCRHFGGSARLTRSDLLVEHMERFCLTHADVVTTPTRAARRAIERHLLRPDKGAIHDDGEQARDGIIPNPLRCDEHVGDGERNGYEVVCVGRLEWLKGQDLLVRAIVPMMEQNPAIILRCFGRGTRSTPLGLPMRRLLRRMIPDSLRGRVIFEGACPRSEVMDAIRRCAIVVVPSRYENQSYAIAEAMACGACVVASDAGGTPDLIRSGRDGLLFRAGDAEDLAATLGRAMADADLRASLGRQARERVRACMDPRESARRWIEAMRQGPAHRVGTVRSARERISVVVPFYNAGGTIRQTISSIKAQTRTPDEVLVVDDGSDDPASLRVLEQIEGAGDARVLRGRHGGVSNARNRGIEAAGGELVCMIDADDIADSTLLEKLERCLRRHPDAAYASPLIADFEDDPTHPTGGWVPIGLERSMLGAINVAGSGTGVLMRRSALEQAGGYDEQMPAYEDWDLYCAMLEKGMRGEVVPEFLIRYRQRPGSLMKTRAARLHDVLHARILAKHPVLAHPDAMRLLVSLASSEVC